MDPMRWLQSTDEAEVLTMQAIMVACAKMRKEAAN